MKTKYLGLLLLGAWLGPSTYAQLGGIVVADASYSTPVMLTGSLVAAGSLTFQSTLDGAYPMVVAGNLNVHGNIGSALALGDVTVAGLFLFDADTFQSSGRVDAAGMTELRRAGATLTAASWMLEGQTRFTHAGTYTIRATSGNIMVTGQLLGPASGTAVLRLIVPHGNATIVQGAPVNVTVQTLKSEPGDAPATGRFIDISTRGWVGTGDAVLIVGFVIKDGERSVLARAVGPTLADHGVAGTLANPVMEIVDAQQHTVASNAGWNTLSADARTELRNTTDVVGAFPLREGSRDAALLLRLPAGLYTMVVRGQNDSTGITLAEVYEAP